MCSRGAPAPPRSATWTTCSLHRGRQTSSDNIATLCRRHHRLKTHHSGWGYTVLEPGSYLWSSPHGYQFLRDHRGTTDVTRDKTSHPPDR